MITALGLGLFTITAKKEPCIAVSVDTNSMKAYSDSGFGEYNFCGENKASTWSVIQDTCVYGSIAASIAAAAFTGGAAAPAVLFAIGSGSTACDKIAGMNSKWPNKQY